METGKTAAQSEILFNRLNKRYRHLKKWARRIGTNAFRLYDRDIPEIPLVLDLYGDAVSGAIYKRPGEKGVSEEELQSAETWLTAMREAITGALGINNANIFLKERHRMRDRQNNEAQYAKMASKSFYRDAHEGGLTFRVNLSDYLDTGLFLDARKKRALIRSEAGDKRVLNLFAYTSTLSVSAAKGGAQQVDSVDLSNTYLEWGRINFALNGLTLFDAEESSRYNFIRKDVFQFMAQAAAKRSRWDLIILDPPSFSNSKNMRGTLDIKRDYHDLIKRCLLLLCPGGTLWFSTGKKGFSLESTNFPGFSIKDISPELMDEDFKGKRIPFCYKIKSL